MRQKQRGKAGSVPGKATAATLPDAGDERETWLSLREVAQQYDLSVSIVRYLVVCGTVCATNFGTVENPDLRILKSDFEAYEKRSAACIREAILDLGKLLS